MKPHPIMRRATKLVTDVSHTMLWFVDAADLTAIRCRKWHFNVHELAAEAERTLTNGLSMGLRTDTLVATLSLITVGEVKVCDSMLVAVEFFSGGNNVKMRREAHALLSTFDPA
jgi:hypothetical protein